MPIEQMQIYICWQCINGHPNHVFYRYDPYHGTVREVVEDFIRYPQTINDYPCITCRERSFHNVSWELQETTHMDTD